MDDIGRRFGTWLDARTMCGRPIERVGDVHWAVEAEPLEAHVSFLGHAGANEVVELRVFRAGAVEPSFLTRFVLDDPRRARELFAEMAHAFEAELRRSPTRVRVCHGPDEDVEAFVGALATEAALLCVPYAFEAMPADLALASDDAFVATMLTPAVADRQQKIHDANPFAATFSLTRSTFDGGDVTTAVHLLLEALYEVDMSTCYGPCQPSVRPLPRAGRVLFANVAYCDRCVRMGYRVYDNDATVVRGVVTKARLDLRDVCDLVDTLGLCGVSVASLDAIGFVTPGIVNFCSMNLPSTGERDVCLTEVLGKRYGIPVFLDNNTNAAAMGCYLMQDEHQSLTLYRHQLGHMNGGQGTVIDGRLVTGLHNLAGEPKFYERMFCYEGGYSSAVWSEEGLAAVTRNVLLASIATVSPEAAYMAVSTVDDTDRIRRDLERTLPQYCIPELVAVHDYRDRMYLGEVALCLGRL